jgi:hypothetical protein
MVRKLFISAWVKAGPLFPPPGTATPPLQPAVPMPCPLQSAIPPQLIAV